MMRVRMIHPAVSVNPDRFPPGTFTFEEPVGGGVYEGEVPDDLGAFLVSLPGGGYQAVGHPETTAAPTPPTPEPEPVASAPEPEPVSEIRCWPTP